MILASDCVAETHKNWHNSRKMRPRCCINCEISLNASKQGLVSYSLASKAAYPEVFFYSIVQGTSTRGKDTTILLMASQHIIAEAQTLRE